LSSPAPLDPDALAAARAPFGQSRMLPAAAYTSDEVLAWEEEHLFARSWVCAGRADDLAAPGTQRALRVGRDGVLVVRRGDRDWAAFANVCRHRGHELLPCGAGARRDVIRCPYHAWTYDLDGRLRHAPRMGDTAVEPAEHALAPVGVELWGGWSFVNASAEAPALADHLGDLDALAGPYEPEQLVPAATHTYEVAANWKVVHENFHECYHCPLIHPELCRVTDPTSGDNVPERRGAWVGGSMDLLPGAETMSLDGAPAARPLPGLDADRRRQVLYLGLLPNLLLSLHPDYVMTHRVEPRSPGHTTVECTWLLAPEAVGEDGFDPSAAVGFWDVTNRQDWRACESVQRGIGSRHFRPGPLSSREDAVYDFVRLVADAYADPDRRWRASTSSRRRASGDRRNRAAISP
jgi:Rieske 2Fe-2S family protein